MARRISWLMEAYLAEAASPGTAVRVVCPKEAVPSAAASVSESTDLNIKCYCLG